MKLAHSTWWHQPCMWLCGCAVASSFRLDACTCTCLAWLRESSVHTACQVVTTVCLCSDTHPFRYLAANDRSFSLVRSHTKLCPRRMFCAALVLKLVMHLADEYHDFTCHWFSCRTLVTHSLTRTHIPQLYLLHKFVLCQLIA